MTYDERTENLKQAIFNISQSDPKIKHKKDKQPQLQSNTSFIIKGFLQSWRYFDDCKDDIRREFTFKAHILSVAKQFLQQTVNELFNKTIVQSKTNKTFQKRNLQIRKRGVTIIGIHIRRGDFLWFSTCISKFGFTTATATYIDKAMKYFTDKYVNPKRGRWVIFVVCSNALSWLVDNVKTGKSHVVLSQDHKPEEDLAILSLCDHVIVTTGTFSCWAGWLNKGTVFYYKDFPRFNSSLDLKTNRKYFFWPDWIGLN
jgi:galactoside 2-L-fucosyltransferase 1/2